MSLTPMMKQFMDIKSANPDTLLLYRMGDFYETFGDDAIMASDFVECDTILGCHYDTFGYIEIDHQEAIRKFKTAGKKLYLLEIGASMEV